MTPQTFGRIVWGIAYFAITLVIVMGFFLYRQHDQLKVTCRYALASASPQYVTEIGRRLPWCRN